MDRKAGTRAHAGGGGRDGGEGEWEKRLKHVKEGKRPQTWSKGGRAETTTVKARSSATQRRREGEASTPP